MFEKLLLLLVAAFVAALIYFAVTGCAMTTKEDDQYDWNPFKETPDEQVE